VPGGVSYRLRADGPEPVQLDTVALPGPAATAGDVPGGQAAGAAGTAGLLVSDLRDCAAEVTGDRRFRVLFGPGRGCAEATQFVGEIPPGRAPAHSHAYDEVVLILAGDGVVHAGGTDHPLAPGTCVHLPPGQQHCLENTGQATLMVLGVFHPGGSPAAKQEPAARP
jgi:mannose-6-phosphate isomerase-like protein (cupin superfamily)